MKILQAICCIILSGSVSAQVYVDHKIPSSLVTGERTEADLVIHKPLTKDFAQYEITFQPGIAITVSELAGGTFKSDDNRIRVMWSISPKEEEIRLRLVLLAGSAGSFTLGHRFEYDFEGERRVAVLQDQVIEARVGGVAAAAGDFRRLNQVIPGKLPLTRIDSLEVKMQDPVQAGIHVAQLRRDAKEARKVGENELKAADLELADAKKELEVNKSIADEKKRSARIKSAEARVQKAEINRQIAEKILALSKSLEANADEIERAMAADSTVKTPPAAASEEVLKQGREITAAAVSDTVYRIQVGAFAQHPGRSPYSSLGRVQVVTEDGLYKVLIGGFRSRDEARQMQRQLAAQGVEGFLVRYQGKNRIR